MPSTRITSRGQISLAVAGVLALVTALLGQSVDTQAQLGDTATATSSFEANENFWPTPVVPSTSCSPTTWLIQDPVISWSSAGTPPGGGSYSYYVTIHHDSSTAMEVIGPVNGTSVRIARNESRWNKGWHARIYTVNGPKTSSGYRSEGFNLNRVWPSTWAVCSGNKAYVPNDGEQDLQGSQPGEFESRQALALGESEILESAQEGPDADLESPTNVEAAREVPATTPVTTTEMNQSSPPQASGSAKASTSMGVTTSVPATTSSQAPSTTSATATATSVQSTPSSSPIPTATSTTAQVPVRAGVGDGPIAVGASQARLEEVDDQARLIVTRGGSDVCAAEVGGASRIESSDGLLTVTVSGRTKSVDLETCELT